MHSESLLYEADGLAMRGELYFDPVLSEPRPAILVFPEAFGLSGHVLSRAARLAQLGYTALACDLHGDRTVHEDFGVVTGLLGELKAAPQRIRGRASGALAALAARPEADPARIAAIGYCFGGTMALELARAGAPIRAAVGFHSGLDPAGPPAERIDARILACIGADDPSIDQAKRNAFEAEMNAAGAPWELQVYGGVVHSFTDPGADARGIPHFARYDARADARSWAAMTGLFDELFAA